MTHLSAFIRTVRSSKLGASLIGLLFFMALEAQVTHTNERVLAGGDFRLFFSIAHGDIDGDGIEDVVFSTRDVYGLFWQKGLADGAFADPLILIDLDGSFAVFDIELHDLNNDDLLDIVFRKSSRIEWYENQGNAVFENEYIFDTIVQHETDIVVRDLDNDGDLDFLHLSVEHESVQLPNYTEYRYYGNVRRYDKDDTGQLVESQVYYGLLAANNQWMNLDVGMQLEDLDFDGDDDLMIRLNSGEWFHKLFVGENDGAMQITVSELDVSLSEFENFELIDVDNDQDLDMLLDGQRLIKNNGIGAFEEIDDFLPFESEKVFWLDYNDDGLKDVLSIEEDMLYWRPLNPEGTFGNATEIGFYQPVFLNRFGDSENGMRRLLLCSPNLGIVLLTESDQGFDFQEVFNNGIRYIEEFQLIDLEGDGDKDVVCAKSNEQGLTYFVNEGLGQFSGEVAIDNAAPMMKELRILDINADGLEDVFFVNANGFGFQINNGDLSFSAPVLYDDPAQEVHNFVIGEVNDIPGADLVVSVPYQLIAFHDIGANGDWNEFIIEDQLDDPYGSPNYRDLVLVDLDGDDVNEIVYRRSTQHSYSFLNAAYVYKAIPIEDNISRRIFADYDDDGDLDVLTRFVGENTVYKNNGSATSFEKETISFVQSSGLVGNWQYVDINGDGQKDFFEKGEGRWMQYLDTDKFYKPIELHESQPSSNVLNSYLVDFDGDGDLDLINFDDAYNQIAWYEYSTDLILDRVYYEIDLGNNCDEDLVHFYNVSGAYIPKSTWFWDFGDGNTSEELSPVHVYANSGSYQATLTVCYENDCKDFTTSPITINVDELLVYPDFDIPTQGEVNQPLQFVDQTEGVNNWSWVFGDGAVSDEHSPSHSFTAPGIYTVELILTNSNYVDCSFWYSQTIEINFPLSIAAQANQNITILPNPFHDFVELRGNEAGKFTHYRITNVQGTEIHSAVLSDNRIDIGSDLLKGMYLLELFNANGERNVHRLLK